MSSLHHSRLVVLILVVLYPFHVMGKGRCPERIDTKTAHSIISEWMKAEFYGKTRRYVARESCVKKFKPRYHFKFQSQKTDMMSKNIDLFATDAKILSLKKISESGIGTDYRAKIQVRGKSNDGKASSFQQNVRFSFPKGAEAILYGCAVLHSSWEKSFLKKSCADPTLL